MEECSLGGGGHSVHHEYTRGRSVHQRVIMIYVGEYHKHIGGKVLTGIHLRDMTSTSGGYHDVRQLIDKKPLICIIHFFILFKIFYTS